MAVITGSGAFAMRMDRLSFYNLLSGTVTASSSTYLKVQYDPYSYDEFFGAGVTYNSAGAPVGGVLTGMKETLNGFQVFSISGFSISASYFYGLAYAGETYTAKTVILKENDRVIGTRYNDYIETFAGNDILNGGSGRDTLVGGKGNDTYYVNSKTDQVLEYYSGGKDTVVTSASYILPSNVENLKTIKASAKTKINLTGNDLNNTITGNAGANRIEGGSGNDVLTGGKGKDTFIFDLDDSGSDIIKDFSVRDDKLAIRDSFWGDMPKGTLNPSFFAIGTAQTENPTVIYDPSSGRIWYDPDGTQSWDEPQYIARVKAGTALTADHFIFI